MKQQSSFVGWDFTGESANGTSDFWMIATGQYPSLCCFNAGFTPYSFSGSGTEAEPYHIATIYDLGAIWQYPTANYILDNSIDTSGTTFNAAVIPWFAGAFNGNSYVISNLTINGGGYLGLFGYIENGSVISLAMEDVDIIGTGKYIGSLCGKNCNGSATECYSSGTVTGTVSNNPYLGGLCGENNGSIASCYSTGSVTGTNHVGGLCGYNDTGSITECYSAGSVTGNYHVGGLCGMNSTGSITSCYFLENAGPDNSLGDEKTATEMQTESTFTTAGWNFVNIWYMSAGGGYPQLSYGLANKIYVDADAAAGGNGSTWSQAYKYLEDALDVANSGDVVWIAEGTYKPGTSQSDTFLLVDGVTVYGGFAGNETHLSQRDFNTHVTILSGDLNGDDGPDFTNYSDNSGLVVDAVVVVGSVLDGVTVTAGYGYENQGAGLYCHGDSGSFAIRNCNFSKNYAIYSGGGAYVHVKGTIEISNCTFSQNRAAHGGGAYCNGSWISGLQAGDDHGIFVDGCIFENNYATGSAGGFLYSSGPRAIIKNSDFVGNQLTTSSGFGSGVCISNVPSAAVNNCIFSHNTDVQDDGGLCFDHTSGPSDTASYSVSYCSFNGNTAALSVYGHKKPALVLSNCIMWDNGSQELLLPSYGTSGAPGTVIAMNCAIEDCGGSSNWQLEEWLYDGGGNIDTDPLFVDTDGPDNIAGTIDDDLSLQSGSPCIGTGIDDVNMGFYSGESPADETPPITPSFYIWEVFPEIITMQAYTNTLLDIGGAVQYYFQETSGNSGGDDSGWVSNPYYYDMYLQTGTQYKYRVKARDWAGNESPYSSEIPVVTSPPDSVPPAPDPMTWDVEPYRTGATSISMTATIARDLTIYLVEYYFECTSGGGPNRDWSSNYTYEPTGLVSGVEYTYRVKARDRSPQYNETGWSSEASATPGISAASNPNPVNGATDVAIDADLSWTAGVDAVSHDVYFGINSNAVIDATTSSDQYKGNQSGTTFDATMAASTTYYWRIDEHNNGGGSIKGDLWSFTTGIDTTPPGQASNPSPANGAEDVAVDVDLSWTANIDAVSHNVYFGTTSPGTFCGNQSGTTYDTGTMAYNTPYYWRIDEVDGGGTTTGTVWSFITIVAVPGQAGITNPVNGADDVATDVTLSWTTGSDAESHDVYFSTDSTFSGILPHSNEAATTYTLEALACDTLYYWRIDEVNAAGTTTGELWSFTTIVAAPGKAMEPYPTNGASDVSVDVILRWTAGNNATSHDVYFGQTSPGTFRENRSDASFDPGTLAYNTTYYWRINEVNAGGTTTGEVWSFTTLGQIIYVDNKADSGGDGSSWGTAYKYLQDALALNVASFGDEIWIAAGTYITDRSNSSPDGTGSVQATFALVDGVAIYGGFTGNEFIRSERDWNNNETILDGDVDGGYLSRHVLSGENKYLSSSTVLDGFTIRNGKAYGDYASANGGGLYLNGGDSPAINNCKFLGNIATGKGGGIYMDGCSATLVNCTFEGVNTGTKDANYGGGIAAINCNFAVQDCSFSNCYTVYDGASIYVNGGSYNISNCSFVYGSARYGGGLFLEDSSATNLTKCAFVNNQAQKGGGIYNENATANTVFDDCIFSCNSANSNGGGIYSTGMTFNLQHSVLYKNLPNGVYDYNNTTARTITVTDSIFYDNGEEEIGWVNSNSEVLTTISYSNINGCLSEDGVWQLPCINGGNNIDFPPLFVGSVTPAGVDGKYFTPDDGFLLEPETTGVGQGSSGHDMGIYLYENPGDIGYNWDVSEWQIKPYATDSSTITMTVANADHLTGPIAYRVEELSGNAGGGIITNWQSSRTFNFIGLAANSSYLFRVQAKDGNGVEAEWSDVALALTGSDTQPPVFSVGCWSQEPSSVDAVSVTMEAGTANDNGGGDVEYYFEEISEKTNAVSSDWQTGSEPRTFSSTGLRAGTKYSYRVKARDAAGNETEWSAPVEVTTASPSNALQVIITPTGAAKAGVQWCVDGGTWHNSGELEEGLTTGNHVVAYSNVAAPEYSVSAPETVAVSNTATTVHESTSTRAPTFVYVSSVVELKDAIAKSNAGDTINLIPGTYDISDNKMLKIKHTLHFKTTDPAHKAVINCNGQYPGFNFDTTDGSSIRYLEIRDAKGFAITCIRSKIDIDNCKIVNPSKGAVSGNMCDGISIMNCSFESPTIGTSEDSAIKLTKCANSVILYCQISGFKAANGGGIYLKDCENIEVRNVDIFDNTATAVGGGICLVNCAALTIQNCTVEGNEAKSGCGVYLKGCRKPQISITDIKGNNSGSLANGLGGGIYCDQSAKLSSIIIDGCTISENANGQGGGIYLTGNNKQDDPSITSCTINDNQSIYASSAAGKSRGGGGIMIQKEAASITNCVITANKAYGDGGGILFGKESKNDKPHRLVNCTISDNIAGDNDGAGYGGGIYFAQPPRYHNAEIVNCILWYNEAWEVASPQPDFGHEIAVVGAYSASRYKQICVSHSCVKGGTSNIKNIGSGSPGFLVWESSTNVANCPFVGSGVFPYRLQAGSPYIDAGKDVTGEPYGIEVDRLYFDRDYDYPSVDNGSIYDIGAYEMIQTLPGQPTLSAPVNEADDVEIDCPSLNWTGQESNTGYYEVYFGTNSSQMELLGKSRDTTCELGKLDPLTTYYWKINAVNVQGSVSSTNWNFRTLPLPPDSAYCLDPCDGTLDVGEGEVGKDDPIAMVVLCWKAGPRTDYHDVYFGTDSTAVANAGINNFEYKGNQAKEDTDYNPGELARDTTYYWRIDEIGDGGITTGPVWRFTTVPEAPSIASNEYPIDEYETYVVTPAPTLFWDAGEKTETHNIYFGTDSSNLEWKTTQEVSNKSFLPTDVIFDGTVYYWRVDEVNAGGVATGPVWSFIARDRLQEIRLYPSSNYNVVSDNLTDRTGGNGLSDCQVHFGRSDSSDFSDLYIELTVTNCNPSIVDTITFKVKSESDQNGIDVTFTETGANTDIYRVDQPIHLSTLSDQAALDLQVLDEEHLYIYELSSVKVDRGEVATITADLFPYGSDPQNICNSGASMMHSFFYDDEVDLKWWSNGEAYYQSIDSVFQNFVKNVGNVSSEADILFECTHGSSGDLSGSGLYKPGSISGPRIESTDWEKDIEWAILYSCYVLGTEGEGENDDPDKWTIFWEDALLRMSDQNQCHGILASSNPLWVNYSYLSVLENHLTKFLELVEEGETVVEAYMDSALRTYQWDAAALFHQENLADTIFDFTPDTTSTIMNYTWFANTTRENSGWTVSAGSDESLTLDYDTISIEVSCEIPEERPLLQVIEVEQENVILDEGLYEEFDEKLSDNGHDITLRKKQKLRQSNTRVMPYMQSKAKAKAFLKKQGGGFPHDAELADVIEQNVKIYNQGDEESVIDEYVTRRIFEYCHKVNGIEVAGGRCGNSILVGIEGQDVSSLKRRWHNPVRTKGQNREVISARSALEIAIEALPVYVSNDEYVITKITLRYVLGKSEDGSDILTPAWGFRVGRFTWVYVDAFTGQIVGEI